MPLGPHGKSERGSHKQTKSGFALLVPHHEGVQRREGTVRTVAALLLCAAFVTAKKEVRVELHSF